jgi:Phytanoyl-CoA dioxygenase (PhyH)
MRIPVTVGQDARPRVVNVLRPAALAGWADGMIEITAGDRRAFRERGYVVLPGVLDERGLAAGRRTAAAMLAGEPPAEEHRGPYFLWPRFGGGDACEHGLLRLYRQACLEAVAAALLRPDLPPDEPDFAQLATTIPPYPHRPGGPHVDGITPVAADGQPGTFSLLAGLWLTDHSAPDQGNLWVWPGTHLRAGAWLRSQGAAALGTLSQSEPPAIYPPVELGSPEQVTGPAGSVLLAHYLLGHNIGGHAGPAGAPMRQVVYYRLQARGHRQRWQDAVTEPLAEFRA